MSLNSFKLSTTKHWIINFVLQSVVILTHLDLLILNSSISDSMKYEISSCFYFIVNISMNRTFSIIDVSVANFNTYTYTLLELIRLSLKIIE